jgi:polyphenol oxidase
MLIDKDIKYLSYEIENARVIFFTAEGNANFNINTVEGVNNLQKVKEVFSFEDVAYVKQIHSDKIHIYDGSTIFADAIVTDKPNVALGVFTADCVPVIIVDSENNAIAAVHSGWKGTYLGITSETIKKMNKLYGSRAENLRIFIGPHIRQCCYEVGHEVQEKFMEKAYFSEDMIKHNRLSLEQCIINQCLEAGILINNIINTGCCTFCCEELSFFSYRKNKDTGRMLSMVYMKK